MKKMLVIAVAAALVAPAAAMADTTLYGKLHASVGSVDNGAGSDTIVESHSSRFGVKGSTELDNGLSATYGLEYGIDLDGDNSRTLAARNTFAGVKGNFGEVRIGRHDTPAKLATAGLDAFADTYGAMENIIATDGHRVDNAVAYINKFGPVGFAYAYSTAPLSSDSPAAVPPTVAAGSDTAANTVMANYSNGPIYAGLGYTDIKNVGTTANLGLGYKAEAGHFANLVYEQAEGKTGLATNPNPLIVDKTTGGIPPLGGKDTNVYVAGGFKTGAATIKAAYGEGKRDGAGNGKEKQTSVGVDYSLGKKTSAYLLWNEDKNMSRAAVELDTDAQTATVVGLVTEF